MSPAVKVVAILVARDGQAGALETLLRDMAAPSRSEPGNLRWDLWRDRADPDRFVIDELYADEDAAAAHHDTAHYRTYAGRIGTLAERTPLVLAPVEVAWSRMEPPR